MVALVLRRPATTITLRIHKVELSVHFAQIKLLRLTVVHEHEVVQLRWRLIAAQVEGHLLLGMVRLLHVLTLLALRRTHAV